MFERIKAVLIKEFKQIFRDPRMKTIIFVSPLIQVILFGYAANKDINYIPLAVYDRDNTVQSRDFIRDFTYSKYFVPKFYIYSDKEQNWLLDKGSASVVLRIDRGFGRNLEVGKDATAQFALDGSDSNTAQIVLGYANTIMSQYQYNLIKNKALETGKSVKIPSIDLRDRAWFNQNLISRNYYIPGVIAMIVTIMSLLLSSMAIVREKEIGTMEQLIVSPLRPIELIAGKLIPFAIIALLQITLITLLGVIWFKIPLRGNLLLLLFATIIYLMTTLGAGLFISTLASTQQEAMMSVFLFYTPVALLSGFAYPIQNMPQVIQILTFINPLRYFLVILRGIFLKGIGISMLWDQILPLFIMGIVVITLSAGRFRRSLG